MRVPTRVPGFDAGASPLVEGDAVSAMVDGLGRLLDDLMIDSNLQQYVEPALLHVNEL